MSQGAEEDSRKVTVEVVRRGSGEMAVVARRMRSQSSVGRWGRSNAGVKGGGGGLHEDDVDIDDERVRL